MTITFRHIGSLCLAAVITISLAAGCGREEEPVLEEKPEITMWYSYDNPRDQTILADLIDGFNETQDQVILKTQYVPSEDMKKRIAYSMADDTMPELAMIDSVDFMSLNSMERFVDLTDALPQLKEYMPVAVIPCTWDNRIYGLPFEMNCPALFYNKTILEENGCQVPKTWEEFYDTALKTSRREPTGFAITALNTEETIYQFLPILWSMGGDLSDISSKESEGAFQLLYSLARNGAMNRQSVDLTMADLLDQFTEGNLAMMFQTSRVVDTIRSMNPDLDFDVAEFPQGIGPSVSVVGGEILAVSEGPYQEIAIEFLKYAADEKRMLEYLDGIGGLSPREDVLALQFKDDPVNKQFIDIFQTARPREFTPFWPRISAVVTEAVGKVIVGDQKPEEILGEVAGKIKKIREEQP